MVKDAIVQLVLIIRTIGMLVLGRSELQSKTLEYDIFPDLYELSEQNPMNSKNLHSKHLERVLTILILVKAYSEFLRT